MQVETDPTQILKTDPAVLEGVASAYCYKLELMNPELKGKVLQISEENEVFSFKEVNKPRALRKENLPIPMKSESLNPSQTFSVSVRLMTGFKEIKRCECCPQWKDKTSLPFLLVTPTGERNLLFPKNPTLLVIIR